MLRKALASGLLSSVAAAACGGGPPPVPRVPQSEPARAWERRIGAGIQDCGEAVRNIDDRSCSLQSVHECLHSAFESCRPARGLHLFATSEGDAVRVDYFVTSIDGACVLLTVEDRSTDPVGAKGVVTKRCRSAVWRPQPDAPGCQMLDPIDCSQDGEGPEAQRKP